MARRPPTLTGKQRSHLRALAHALKPIVQIGQKGLTAGVTQELSAALETHELVKVKLDSDRAREAEELLIALERDAECHVVQHIGRTFVVYRMRERDPTIVLPARRRPRAGRSGED
ncbi:MAG: ribosome assembly RNA-binding protein YhbY [Polyangiaceae bacterium]